VDDSESGPTAGRDGESRRIWWIVAAILLALALVRWAPGWKRSLEPRPAAAYVALLADGDAVATDGPHRLEAGRPFRLFAVLEAKAVTGGTVWYSDAPALRLGGRDVPRGSLRRWPAGRIARVRWFTVDGSRPFLDVASAADLDHLRFVESFHPDWGSGWSVPGVVDPQLALIEPEDHLRPLGFGTERWAVRIELYGTPAALTPSARASSPGAERVLDDPKPVTSLVATLPGPLGVVSAAFGEPVVKPGPTIDPEARGRIDSWLARGLVIEGDRLLARYLDALGISAEKLAFHDVELGPDGPRWGTDVRPGDFLRAGERLVILDRDRGVPGRLDPEDVVFSFEDGARDVVLSRLFAPVDGRLRLELAPVARRVP
jgi:hypothetical protein